MAKEHRPALAVLIDCIARDRAPSVHELDGVAATIWTESSPARSALGWRRLEPSSDERVMALRVALAAVKGSEA